MFIKFALLSLLFAGLQPVLAAAKQKAAPQSVSISKTKVIVLSAPTQKIGKKVLPDLQKSHQEDQKTNFVQTTYILDQENILDSGELTVGNAAVQKELQVSVVVTATLKAVENKFSIVHYQLQPAAQNDQPVISAARFETQEAAQTVAYSFLGITIAAVAVIAVKYKEQNSIRFEILRC